MFREKKQNAELKAIIQDRETMIAAFTEESLKLEKEIEDKTDFLIELTRKLSGIKVEDNDDFDIDYNTRAVFAKIQEMNTGIEISKAILKNLSNSLEQISSGTCEIAASVNQITATVNNSSNLAGNMVEISKEGMEISQKTLDSNIKIKDNYQKITEIILFLKNLAADIKNLSFNTSIQAAHAGEYGKGFSVIADEIRKLSDSTAIEIKNIELIINENKKVIDESVIDANNSKDNFGKIVDMAEQNKNNSDETLHAMNEINASTNQTSVLLSEIAANTSGMKKEYESIENKEESIEKLINKLSIYANQNELDFIKDLF